MVKSKKADSGIALSTDKSNRRTKIQHSNSKFTKKVYSALAHPANSFKTNNAKKIKSISSRKKEPTSITLKSSKSAKKLTKSNNFEECRLSAKNLAISNSAKVAHNKASVLLLSTDEQKKSRKLYSSKWEGYSNRSN
jgi:hypothetical protein